MVQGLVTAGIPAAQIGEMTDSARHVIHADGRIEEITDLDTDEIYRLVEQGLGAE